MASRCRLFAPARPHALEVGAPPVLSLALSTAGPCAPVSPFQNEGSGLVRQRDWCRITAPPKHPDPNPWNPRLSPRVAKGSEDATWSRTWRWVALITQGAPRRQRSLPKKRSSGFCLSTPRRGPHSLSCRGSSRWLLGAGGLGGKCLFSHFIGKAGVAAMEPLAPNHPADTRGIVCPIARLQ